MKAWVLHLAIARRKWVFWGLALLTAVMVAQLPRIQIDTDPENMLPADNQARIFHNQARETFAMHDAIVVGAVNNDGIYTPESLAALKSVSDFAAKLDGVIVQDLMSLSAVDNITQEGPGTIRFEWMMKQVPETSEKAAQLRSNVERLPLLFNTLVSEDGKAAAIYVPIIDKNQSYAIARQLQAHIDSLSSTDQWHITGLPVAEDRFGYEMFVQMGISAPLAGLMIFVLLFIFFRNVPFITAPMIVAMATVLITMGLLIGMGFTVHIMSSMIAIFLMPIAVVDSVHIMSEFADRYRPGMSVKEVIKDIVGHLFTPMLYTSVTSTVGFLSLMLTPIPPVQIFGAFVGFGIMLAFVITIVFIPAYLVSLNPATLDKMQQHLPDETQSKLAGAVRKLGKLAGSHAKLWLMGFMLIFAFSMWGISKIQINDNPVRWFKQDHQLRVADRVLNDHFAGTYDAFLVLQSTTAPNTAINRALETAASSMSPASANWLQSLKTLGLDEAISAIDDKLFDMTDSTDQAALEQLMMSLEQINRDSKVFTQPEVLEYMAGLQAHMQQSGLVGKSNSLTDVVKTVNRELRSGEQSDYQLPATANGVAQALLQYQSSHRPDDLWHFVTPDYQQSLLWLQLTSGDNQDMTAVVDLVDAYVATNPLPEGLRYDWAGKAYLNVVWQQAMVAGMLDSLISAFITVFIMMVILFRSLVYGTLAMLPLTITISLIYGLIGWIGKDYDMPIAVLSSLTLGLSVDFAIHFLERARDTYRNTGNLRTALQVMFEEPGRAISRNAIVIAMGFTPLLFAPLVPYITVGIFLASIMAVSALVTLIMLPALMTLLQRRV